MQTERPPLGQRVQRILVLDPVDLARIGLTSVIAAVARFVVCAATGDLDEGVALGGNTYKANYEGGTAMI